MHVLIKQQDIKPCFVMHRSDSGDVKEGQRDKGTGLLVSSNWQIIDEACFSSFGVSSFSHWPWSLKYSCDEVYFEGPLNPHIRFFTSKWLTKYIKLTYISYIYIISISISIIQLTPNVYSLNYKDVICVICTLDLRAAVALVLCAVV